MGEDFNITGTWINRLTGEKITVRNTIIDGDDMIIIGSDGRQLKMSEFQNYIQMSDEKNSGHDDTAALGNIRGIENERRVIVGSREPYQQNVFSNVPNNPFDFDSKIESKQQLSNKIEKLSESEKLLNKLFEKIELDIDVKVDLDCTNFPSKELNMLQTIYDVSIEDISDYLIKNVINEEIFKSAVANYINAQLS